ncbi:MAG TPA: hypothetical protein VFB29_01360 [Pseudolabrys sp.]|nr:hypothetical protein [Pseudolabrys sp.]
MTGCPIAALAAALLLAVSGPALAAKRMSGTKGTAQSQSEAASTGATHARPAVRRMNRDPYAYSPAPNRYDRDDPYAPGVNWPGHW